MRLPPLSALPAFEATARLGSVSAAAQELGRTHSAVSKQLKALATDLGGDLFERQGTGLRLSARGHRLQEKLSPMLHELSALGNSLRRETERPQVRVALGATLATRWLTPRLANFYCQHPLVQVHLIMSGPHRNMDEEQFDVMLSYDRLRGPFWGTNPKGAMETREIGDTSYGVVCAPDYPVTRTGAGLEVPLRLTHAGAPRPWAVWEDLSGQPVTGKAEQEHPHHILALEAAAVGMGVSLSEYRLVAEDLASGRLIAPLGFVAFKGGFQAGIMAGGRNKPGLDAFLAWLQTAARPATLQDADCCV